MKNLIVSTSPHFHAKATTPTIMRDVLIALAPAAIAAVVLFGFRALLILAVCVATCVASEFIFNLIIKKKQTVSDLSACVTGTLLALSLPATTSLWQCLIGSIFAIVVVKCLFGGIGCNFANPAVTARVFMLIAFATSIAGGTITNFQSVDLIGSATPLDAIKMGNASALPSLLDMLLGNRGGAIGETCVLALVLGGIYLIARKVIYWHTPAIFIGTVFLLSLAIKQDLTVALYQILGGGVVLAAFFMATDYSTTPINKTGKMVFAFGCGVITVLIRFWGSYPEGVSFAILLMNILAPYIEKLCAKRPFGKEGK
ncbi:MAG: RnfABCDGE type electron transport complex subunit D [Clostridia bacterium]|nr:RnfABCDGE type electron transport complex subunit D [Clostridia bacterium]